MRRLAVPAPAALATGLVVVGLTVALVLVALDDRDSTSPAAAPAEAGGLAAPGEQTLYGHIGSLRRVGDRYELRFDPASFLSGVTANVAASEDQGTPCRAASCPPVPNDNYAVDESHRLYTYVVPRAAQVTVITNRGSPAQLGATPITVAQLAQIVGNGKAPGVTLFETLDSGVWIRVRIDTVRSLAQQYRP
jgi:hypothetical protein